MSTNTNNLINKQILNTYKQLNIDNPLEHARVLLAPLCLTKTQELISTCNSCSTCSNNKQLPYGNSNANIVIINDNASSNQEYLSYLYELLEIAEIDIKDILIINAVSCICTRSSSNKPRLPSREEAINCKDYVEHILDFVKPRMIISMGATALNQFMPNTKLIEEINITTNFYSNIKTFITYSIKDIFNNCLDQDDMAQQVLNQFITANNYLQSLNI